ncbi:GIDE domain-containing protein [Endothiovibrio diazotrophicus]
MIFNSFAGAGHLVLLLFAWVSHDLRVWAAVLWAMALISIVSWIATYRRARLIRDTPTARIASAGQGFTELVGMGEAHPGGDLAAGPMWIPPSLWYRYHVRCEDSNGRSRGRSSRTSDDTFLLRDDSGVCVIDPDHAEVVTTHKRTRREGDCVYEIEYLRPGDTLYALGEFVTVRAGDTPLDPNADTAALLREWKGQSETMKRFDTNGDGKIDEAEWAAARHQARAEVAKQHMTHRLAPGVHMLRVPTHGRLFLLSNIDPDHLAQRFLYWSWFHLALFLVSAVAAPVLTGRLLLAG